MISLESGVPLVAVERSGVIESLHTGHLIVLRPDGSIALSRGNPQQPIFARSCLKPLQATGMLAAGFDGTVSDIALAAASHSGSRQHRALIEQSLTDAGLSLDDLGCPAAFPIGDSELRAYLAAETPATRVAMNCSGKHAAMLRTCLRNRWDIAGYLSPHHPLQATLAATVSELAGEQIAATGIDGCGAPAWAMSLTSVARAFAAIARAETAPAGLVAQAMRTHPELVGGSGRLNTLLMQGIPGLIAKDGAEGCFAAALADGGAVAVKIDDGAGRAAERVVVAGLRHLGASGTVLDAVATVTVLGGDSPVGTIRPIF